ncbi:ABC transporter ATP-binding protein [Tyzzerella nexilis]|nr:ABC transporter ATP-binding protein [[Clostridium] nexile]MCB7557672.1 ABC transporter ATP-binding protein [[Clostridium] nexile]MCC3676335.1 ABC transporter ATP-binding protein [[Clostridium] nexile]NSD85748.1 ABC transporter ATP-binding protein [[Clostridium] nexile]NSD88240.1 ABC transporter ATP-binding protein [[Clostridium] nexile]
MIEVKNLVKKYGDHTAVDHLSFTVEKGQIYGFLGPNGAGKSTTMNIMTGYLGATDGEVLINGHDILKEPEAAKKSIGYLPELPPLYMDMTVMEYLKFSAELKKIKKEDREAEIEKALKLVKLADVQDRLIKNLSKGYKQRVGLAQAILGFPEIIILDEPTVGLDPKQIIEIRELIRELAKEHTVILSSHILAEIREVCDYIMIISKGKLVVSDTPEHLEELMNGSDTIHIETRAEEETVREILSGLEDIEDVTYTQENEILKAEVKTKERKDIREAIFSAFAEAQCPLLTLQKTTVSLEEVFLELTGGQKSDESNL